MSSVILVRSAPLLLNNTTTVDLQLKLGTYMYKASTWILLLNFGSKQNHLAVWKNPDTSICAERKETYAFVVLSFNFHITQQKKVMDVEL